jgi:hypothetical protein
MVGWMSVGWNDFSIKISSLFVIYLSSVSPFMNVLKQLSAGAGTIFNQTAK